MEGHRVILIGKTGNGKSSTGNSILGTKVFDSKNTANSVTSQCAVHTREREGGRVFTVCDTPGLFCHGEDPIEMSLKLQRSVEICPKPHAFILVFSGASRMTTDEKYTITLLRVIFGDKMFDHCIVVITRGDEFETDSELVEFWNGNDELKKIVESCGKRVVKIENKKDPLQSQLNGLLYMIETLSSNGGYDHRFLKTHTEVLQEYKHKYGLSNSEDIDTHLNEILNMLQKKLEEEKQRLEEEKRQAEEERKRLENKRQEEEKRRAEEAKAKAEEEKRKAEEGKRQAEEEIKRLEEELKRVKEDKELKQKLEEEKRKRKEEKHKRIMYEQNAITKKLEEEERKKNEETRKRRIIENGLAYQFGEAVLTISTAGLYQFFRE